jgi:hypothetical protein
MSRIASAAFAGLSFKPEMGMAMQKDGKIISAFSLPGWLALFFFVFQFHVAASAKSISATKDYADRLQQAGNAIEELIEQESPAAGVGEKMSAIKRLLPSNEEVESNGAIIRVDNSWLHNAADDVVKNAAGDIEQRHSMLREIADRLANLRQQVIEAQIQTAAASPAQRQRLESILARPEYQPEEKREAFVQRWLRKLWVFLARIFEGLFGRSASPAPSAGLLSWFRILIVLVLIAVLVFGMIKLAQRLQARKKAGETPEVREVLGEEIAEDVTAADLFAKAAKLARQGAYRAAIRRAYVALLCELEQRDKLRLHRSKTNRDYLDALRSEQQIFPAFSVMTDEFEQVWYGQERATEEEFKDFVRLYQETIR